MDFQRYYNCSKCSRITSSYPLGCSEQDCPVKTDFKNDFEATINFIICGLVVFLFVIFFKG